MGIQSSVNALMQQIYTIGAIGAGLREQKKQTKASVANLPSFEERFRKYYNIDKNTPLTEDQKQAVKYGELKQRRGTIVEPGESTSWIKYQKARAELMQIKMELDRPIPKVENEIASDLAKSRVESRTDSINQTKSNFDEHVASLIRYYGKGSENP